MIPLHYMRCALFGMTPVLLALVLAGMQRGYATHAELTVRCAKPGRVQSVSSFRSLISQQSFLFILHSSIRGVSSPVNHFSTNN
jgi:hypothetical protein